MGGFLFWNTLVLCFLSVNMAVWEPLMIVKVTGNTSVSPMDVWTEHEPRQRSQDTTAMNWISNVTDTLPFVSGRLNTWGNERPKMLIVQAAKYKNEKMDILQTMQFNTTTVAAKGFNHWMKNDYLTGPNKTQEFIESPARRLEQGALFRYSYGTSSNLKSGVSTTVSKGGMTFLLDTQNVSERGSLLLTSNVRNIGNIEDIIFNLNHHRYVSSLPYDENTTPDNTKERISDVNHKITRTQHQLNTDHNLELVRFEMEQGVIVKEVVISTAPTFLYLLDIKMKGGATQTKEVSENVFSEHYGLEFLSMEIKPHLDGSIHSLYVAITYSYLPYDVADYFIIQGLFVSCDDPPTINNTAVHGTGFTVGSSRTYNCTNGTSVVSGSDPATSHCQNNWTWSTPNITCDVSCDDPPTINNTTVHGTGFTVGSSRTYNCTNGTSVVSGSNPATSHCQNNGTWSNPTITCAVNCGEPLEVPNTSIRGTGNTVGSERKYTCRTGTSLVSDTQPTWSKCQNSGNWSSPNIVCEVIPTSDATAVTELPTTTSNPDSKSKNDRRDTTSSAITYASSTTILIPEPNTAVTPRDRTSSIISQASPTTTSPPSSKPRLDTTTSIPTDTTSASIVVPAPTCTRPCGCRIVSWGNTTKLAALSSEKLAERKTMITKLKGELTVNKSGLSTYRATKTSASDDRSSAAGIGAVGIIVIIFAVALVVLADVTSFMTSRKTQPLHIS